MIYLNVIGNCGVQTFVSDDIKYLLQRALEKVEAGTDYRVISKKDVLRIDVISEEPYIAVWTHLKPRHHCFVVDQYLQKMGVESDECTEIE